jgi:Flp pilus assembly protein CpaB
MIQRRRGLRAIAIGVVLVILALLVALFLLLRGGGKSTSSNTAAATPTAVPTGPVVVAAYSIPQGTVFTSGQDLAPYFTVRSEPVDVIPFGAYTSVSQISDFVNSTSCGVAKTSSCVGRATTAQTIYAGEPVLSGMISSLGAFRTAAGPSFQIPYGYVAIGMSFSDINSVVNSIEPGDDIDLIASYVGTESTANRGVPSQTQYVLNDVRVLSINGPPAQPQPAPAPTTAPAAGQPAPTAAPPPTPPPSGGTLLLLVRYQQALIIQHLKDFGGTWTTSVVLRSAKETDIPHFRTLPVTARWFFVKQANHFDFTNPY